MDKLGLKCPKCGATVRTCEQKLALRFDDTGEVRFNAGRDLVAFKGCLICPKCRERDASVSAEKLRAGWRLVKYCDVCGISSITLYTLMDKNVCPGCVDAVITSAEAVKREARDETIKAEMRNILNQSTQYFEAQIEDLQRTVAKLTAAEKCPPCKKCGSREKTYHFSALGGYYCLSCAQHVTPTSKKRHPGPDEVDTAGYVLLGAPSRCSRCGSFTDLQKHPPCRGWHRAACAAELRVTDDEA